MLKHCTSSTTDLRARPIQSFAKEGDKLVRGPGEAEGNRKTSLVTTDQIATAFESPKLGRPVRYGFKPVAHRGRSQSLEPALPPSCPASPSLAHRSSLYMSPPHAHILAFSHHIYMYIISSSYLPHVPHYNIMVMSLPLCHPINFVFPGTRLRLQRMRRATSEPR